MAYFDLQKLNLAKANDVKTFESAMATDVTKWH